MVTITYEKLMMILALFTALCVAGGWLLKIVKGIKKPANDVHEKLDRDFKKINKLEEQQDWNSKAIKLSLRSELAILKALPKNGNAADIGKIEADIQEFLLNN